MTDPIRASIRKAPVQSTATGAPPPATQEAPPTAAQNRDAAIADVHQTQRANPRRRPQTSWRQAATDVARAYDDGGLRGLRAHLAQRPSSLRAIAEAPRGQVENLMQDVAGLHDGSVALSVVRDVVQSNARESVRRRANGILNERISDLRALGADLSTNLDSYVNAAPGSAHAAIADALGIGPATTPTDAAAKVSEAVEGLQELRGRFAGNTWRAGDFPESIRAAYQDMGLRIGTPGGSMLDDIASDQSADVTNAANVVPVALDAVHVVIEAGHVAQHLTLGGVALGAGLLVGGIALGSHIHHMAEERRAEAIGDARSLGI